MKRNTTTLEAIRASEQVYFNKLVSNVSKKFTKAINKTTHTEQTKAELINEFNSLLNLTQSEEQIWVVHFI